MQVTGESWALLGASKGLGKNVAEQVLQKNLCSRMLLISRKIEKTEFASSSVTELEKFSADFSQEETWSTSLEKIKSFKPERLLYFAGGGPYGEFEKKNWKDHQWAYRVNFLFPSFLLHQLLSESFVRQIVFVGSSIAESQPDPQAASYAASKHALKGLISTVQAEIKGSGKKLDLRLFSPGYMDTSLLPADAWPRQQQGKVMSLDNVTDQLLPWLSNPNDANTQLVLSEKSLLK